MLLRYPYEVRDASEYFDDIQDMKITKDMLDLAKHIVEHKSGTFEPEKFEDHYEAALIELINRKRNGERIIDVARPREAGNVVSLMEALKRSLANEGRSPKPAKGKKPRKRLEGQSEMLLPISCLLYTSNRAGALSIWHRWSPPRDRVAFVNQARALCCR